MKVKNYSRKREAILAKMRSTRIHPTAEWVFQELKDDYPDLSLATVYRNLNMFKEEGAIISVGTIGGQERFDGFTHPHAHFVCKVCNEIGDISFKNNQLPTMYLDGIENTQVDNVDLTVYGICSNCVENQQQNKE
ncbi:MAG: transcriptional repressor [Alphaproteobacteria bacterium]|jgi:Fur family peroxide stress response transcriptional regulator|nr:transcriptional repressor [Alphaproteobacteria bacterium]